MPVKTVKVPSQRVPNGGRVRHNGQGTYAKMSTELTINRRHFVSALGVCLFCDDGPEAGRMKPKLVLNDVKRPIVVEVSAEVKRSQFDDGLGH